MHLTRTNVLEFVAAAENSNELNLRADAADVHGKFVILVAAI